ncbi:hypothetical protein G9A89_003892 [Geosiphon pyriformis]|nr:hypothetical protein G9A89_003892 [Geosiphon pyriformis]
MCAVRSLILSSTSVATGTSLGQFFACHNGDSKSKEKNKLPQSHQHITISSLSPKDLSKKGPLKRRFKLFRSKSKKRSSKISSTKCIHSPSSICSEVTSIVIDRLCSSAPNLHRPTTWENSSSLSVTNDFVCHGLQKQTVVEVDEGVMREGIPQIKTSFFAQDFEEDSEEEDWNKDSEDFPSPTAIHRSSLPVPISTPQNRRHNRAMSLPQTALQDLPKSFYHRQPTASETWDDDFESEDVKVPSMVAESQVLIRMDISNIQDFHSQIDELKKLREKKMTLSSRVTSSKKWPVGLPRPDSAKKKLRYLEDMFKSDWDQANVIIEISEVAQDQPPQLNGSTNMELDVKKTSTERHLTVLRKFIDDDQTTYDPKSVTPKGCAASKLGDENKENEMLDVPSRKPTKIDDWNNLYFLRRTSIGSQVSGNSTKKKRREDVRISVDEMPSLIENLRKLQGRLSEHVKELTQMSVRVSV